MTESIGDSVRLKVVSESRWKTFSVPSMIDLKCSPLVSVSPKHSTSASKESFKRSLTI